MADFSTDRLRPTSPVPEPHVQPPQGELKRKPRRRPATVSGKTEESLELERESHQIDDLA